MGLISPNPSTDLCLKSVDFINQRELGPGANLLNFKRYKFSIFYFKINALMLNKIYKYEKNKFCFWFGTAP